MDNPTEAYGLTLVQAQRRFIEKMKPALRDCNKKQAVAARLELSRWAKKHDCDNVTILHDAIQLLELERSTRG